MGKQVLSACAIKHGAALSAQLSMARARPPLAG